MKQDLKKKIGVSIAESSNQFAKQIAEEKYRGNVSAFFQELVDNYESGVSTIPNPMDDEVLVKLASVLLGQLDAEDLKRKIGDKDQRRLLRDLIAQLLEK